MKFFLLAVSAALLFAVVSAAPSSEEDFELFIDNDESEDPAKLLKCIVEAVAKALENTNYDKVIERLKEDMIIVDLKFKTCAAEEKKQERRKCYRKARSLATDLFKDMMRNIGRANGKIYRRMLRSIKQECYDTNPNPEPNPPPTKPDQE